MSALPHLRTALMAALVSMASLHVVAQCTDYDIIVGGGTAPGEISWELVDEFGNTVTQGDAPENDGQCIDDGCYTMYMYDTGNDGWNGGTWTINFENTTVSIASGTLDDGGWGAIQIDIGGVGCGGGGCTDQEIVVTAGTAPLDVYWEIYDQFGNFIWSGGAPENVTLCMADGCYTMYLYDAMGDGWNDAAYTITDVGSGSVLTTGTLNSGGYSTAQLIIGAGCGACDGYTMNVTGGTAPTDVSWDLYDASFNFIASGTAPGTLSLCLPPSCYTIYMYDLTGNGWNGAVYSFTEDATGTVVSSGTLVNGSFGTAQVSIGGGCATPTCLDYTMTVTGGTAPAQVSWNFTSMGVNYASGGAPSTVQMCLDTACYVMQLYDAASNGWNGATWTLTNSTGTTVGTGTLASGASGSTTVNLGTGPCTVPVVVSASDCPQAVNVCTNLNFTIDPSGWGALWEIPTLGSTSNPEYWALDGIMSPWGTDHYGCLMGQEINTTWMIVNIAGSGSLEFTLGANGSQAGFYDWTMFPYNATTCGAILANFIAPVRCNWNYASWGGTGLASTVPSGGVPENFETPLNVLAGQRYIICFSNWSSVTTVVPLVFGGTATVSCTPVVLPIELIDFRAEAAPWSVNLNWTTATEHNTSHFLVQCSLDRMVWQTIGQVQAAGNSLGQSHYGFSDTAPHEGDAYYRLAVIDIDATESLIPWVMVEWEAPILHCWPNPTTGAFLIDLGERIDRADIRVLDRLGNTVPFRQYRGGDDEVRIDLSAQPAGTYWIRVAEGDWVRTGRVVLAP